MLFGVNKKIFENRKGLKMQKKIKRKILSFNFRLFFDFYPYPKMETEIHFSTSYSISTSTLELCLGWC